MTLAVYRMDKNGNRHEVMAERQVQVTPAQVPEMIKRWPDCQCFLCRRVRVRA